MFHHGSTQNYAQHFGGVSYCLAKTMVDGSLVCWLIILFLPVFFYNFGHYLYVQFQEMVFFWVINLIGDIPIT